MNQMSNHILSTNVDSLPETIEWPGRGTATRLQSCGMSDYAKQGLNGTYSTTDGFLIYIRKEYVIDGVGYQRNLSCKAQFKNFTSPSFSKPEQAMVWLDLNLNKVRDIPTDVDWPGLGKAKVSHVTDKGYTVFKTECGLGKLIMKQCSISNSCPEGIKWIASYQGFSTKWLPFVSETIKCVEKMVGGKKDES